MYDCEVLTRNPFQAVRILRTSTRKYSVPRQNPEEPSGALINIDSEVFTVSAWDDQERSRKISWHLQYVWHVLPRVEAIRKPSGILILF